MRTILYIIRWESWQQYQWLKEQSIYDLYFMRREAEELYNDISHLEDKLREASMEESIIDYDEERHRRETRPLLNYLDDLSHIKERIADATYWRYKNSPTAPEEWQELQYQMGFLSNEEYQLRL